MIVKNAKNGVRDWGGCEEGEGGGAGCEEGEGGGAGCEEGEGGGARMSASLSWRP